METPMASLTIRNLNDDVKRRLRLQAAENGVSAEEEARRILARSLLPSRHEDLQPRGRHWVDVITAMVDEVGGVDLDIPRRDDSANPAQFD